MNVIRKLLAVVAAIVSILFIFLSIRAIGLGFSGFRSSTFFDRVVWWLVPAVLLGLSYVLMRFAKKTLG